MTTAIFQCKLIHNGTKLVEDKTTIQVPMLRDTRHFKNKSASIASDAAYSHFWRRNPRISRMTHSVTAEMTKE